MEVVNAERALDRIWVVHFQIYASCCMLDSFSFFLAGTSVSMSPLHLTSHRRSGVVFLSCTSGGVVLSCWRGTPIVCTSGGVVFLSCCRSKRLLIEYMLVGKKEEISDKYCRYKFVIYLYFLKLFISIEFELEILCKLELNLKNMCEFYQNF